jgi:4-hydroxy-3-polyprenylbenzoate decarboxylase
MFSSLREFLSALEKAGELHRVSAAVSPILEITEIADRVSKSPCPKLSTDAEAFDPLHHGRGGRALLFENVEGSDFPLAINVFGSYRRMEMALGVHERGGFATIAARIGSLTKPQLPRSLGEMFKKAKEFWPLLRIGPRAVRSARCQEVVKLAEHGQVDLTRLPLLKCWPLDGNPAAVGYPLSPEQAGTAVGQGRYITFAGMHTIHADDRDDPRPASHNIGMYRAQLLDQTRLAMHWHMHHDGAAHWRSWKKLGRKMPIAICLGGEAVMAYGATAPLPPGISELLMCGFLNGRGIPMARAKTVPIGVPANSEIVIEGWVSTECGPPNWDPRQSAESRPSELGPGAVFEGPFGDHTGFYSLPDRYPILEVTAITHRKDAVYPTTIVGLPPQEDYYLGKATERIFLPLLRTLIPDIIDYHLPMFGVFHNCAFIQIQKHYPLQARRIMHAVWGAGQMSWTKMIVVVDDDVNVHDEAAVLAALARHCDFGRDVELVRGPVDILDHAAAHLGASGKIGFDATRKLDAETLDARPRDPSRAPDAAVSASTLVGRAGITAAHFAPFSQHRMLLLAVAGDAPGRGLHAIESAWSVLGAPIGDLTIALDASVNVARLEPALFHLCANTDPARDSLRRDGRLGLDATTKRRSRHPSGQPIRDFPPLISMDPATRALVDRRWPEYGLTSTGPDR